MDYGAIDLHKRESQVRIVTPDGEVLDRLVHNAFTLTLKGPSRRKDKAAAR